MPDKSHSPDQLVSGAAGQEEQQRLNNASHFAIIPEIKRFGEAVQIFWYTAEAIFATERNRFLGHSPALPRCSKILKSILMRSKHRAAC